MSKDIQKLQEVDITTIKPFWRNARNNAIAIEKVKESIKEFGYKQPIIVDKENVVIVGHTRLEALKRLGYKKINVIIDDSLTPVQVRKYRLVDNKTSEFAEWNEGKLFQELRDLTGEMDSLTTFFGDDLKFQVDNFFGAEMHDELEDKGQTVEDQQDTNQKFTDDFTKANADKQKGQSEIEVVCPACQEFFNIKI